VKYNLKNKQLARNLRTCPTDAEKLFWGKVRRKQLKGYQFYRQRPIGEYIVDFYCPKAGLVVELDGGWHYEEEHRIKDIERSDYFKSLGLEVVRYSNTDVMTNISGVISDLYDLLP